MAKKKKSSRPSTGGTSVGAVPADSTDIPVTPKKVSSPAVTAASSTASSTATNVKVFVRSRPRVPREEEQSQPVLVSMNNNTTTIRNPLPTQMTSPSKSQRPDEEKQFHFDGSLWSTDISSPSFKSQSDTYGIVGHDILEHTLSGYNTCIFAYGQTGSGKSYTMMGNRAEEDGMGIIPRCCLELFERCEMMEENVKAQIKVSFFEIYNEQVRDLLGEQKEKQQLKVRENPETGPYVEGLTEFPIQSFEEFDKYMTIGNKNRTTAATKMNDQSSRSHAVFTLSVRMTEFDMNEDMLRETNSCLRLVDLAGSERANSTGATGVRFKEGSNINKSLTTLGRVISALTKNEKPPYRDSTLTWILKESLGGNSKTAMIACISPCDYEETISTLRYASLVKKIKLNAKVNVSEEVRMLNQEQLMEMQSEIERLKESLDKVNDKDKVITQITNMSKFFENQLVDQETKYNLVKAQLRRSNERAERLRGDLGSILSVMSASKLNAVSEIKNQHDKLLERSNALTLQFERDLAEFAL